MAKRKRFRKRTVFGVLEGIETENCFISFLKEVYLDQALTSFKEAPKYGGNPDRLIEIAIKNLYCGYNQIFVWIDEDKPISDDSKETLSKCWDIDDREEFFACLLKDLQRKHNPNNKNPILIVSQPVCVEALILRVLGHEPKYSFYDPEKRKEQITILKSSLSGVIQKKEPLEFYKENLTKELLESRRKQVPELDLLITIITGIKGS